MKEKRILYLDILKIIATFMVIVIHVTTIQWLTAPINTFDWNVYSVYFSLAKWSVPVFVMVSGVLFLNPKKDISIKDIYKKYVLKMVLILFAWAAFYSVYESYHYGLAINLNNMFFSVILGKAQYHLWFMYLLIGLYIVTPIIRLLIKNADKKHLEYFLILWFVFTSVIPLLRHFSFYSTTMLGFDYLMISGVDYFIGYYVLGHYLHTYKLNPDWTKILYALGIIALTITISGTYWLTKWSGVNNQVLYAYLSPNVAIMSVSMFVLVKNTIEKMKFTDKYKKTVTYLSSLTFGIYLVHIAYVMLFTKLGLYSDFINPIIGNLLVSLLIFGISATTIIVMKTAPFFKKLIF